MFKRGDKVTTSTTSGTVDSTIIHPVSRVVTGVVVRTGPGDDDKVVARPSSVKVVKPSKTKK